MQKGFEKNPKQAPKHWQNTLKLGKVIGVKADKKTVDITMIDGGAVHYDVPVLAPMATTSSGLSHLPAPENPKADTEEGYDFPITYNGRDIFAIIGFVEGIGTMPVVLGFRFPAENQLSFSNNVGANQRLDRHESDRYHRIIGDTVEENGGKDIPGEEEIRYPDNSYFKMVKNGGSRTLEDLSDKNRDAVSQPYIVKKEERKGFYFQHSSGSRIYISPDGEIKISHHTGSWVSIAPNTSNLPAEPVSIGTIDSKNDPQTDASGDPVQIHVGHSSGTRFTILANGKIEIQGAVGIDVVGGDTIKIEGSSNIDVIGGSKVKIEGASGVDIDGGSGSVKGLVQADCVCAFTGRPHIMTSSNVKASL